MLWLAPLLALLLLGGVWDVAKRRIPNPVSASAAVLAIVVQGQWFGWRGVASGLGAGAITLVLLWAPWVKRMLGGGDVKIGVAAALAVGLAAYPRFLLVSAMAGGVLSVVSLLRSSPAARQEIQGNLRMILLRQSVTLPAAGATQLGRVPVPFGMAFVVAAFDSVLAKYAT
jgi:prepilin peptidase CpaA